MRFLILILASSALLSCTARKDKAEPVALEVLGTPPEATAPVVNAPASDQEIFAEGRHLVIAVPDTPPIRVDARFLDAISLLAESREIMLTIGELEVGLEVSAGNEVAKAIIASITPYLGESLILDPENYQHSKRRLAARVATPTSAAPVFITLGQRPLQFRDDVLTIGPTVFDEATVYDAALEGTNLSVPGGEIQAAIALLAIEDARRGDKYYEKLSFRVKAYEARRDSE